MGRFLPAGYVLGGIRIYRDHYNREDVADPPAGESTADDTADAEWTAAALDEE